MGGGSSNFVLLKMLLGVIATVGFACLLLVGTLEGGATKATSSTTEKATFRGVGNMKHEEVIGKEKLVYNSELDLNYMMSKRKVPNGPDPIHNRFVRELETHDDLLGRLRNQRKEKASAGYHHEMIIAQDVSAAILTGMHVIKRRGHVPISYVSKGGLSSQN